MAGMFGIVCTLQCFVASTSQNTVMLKKFQNFQPPNSRNTVMLKKFQKFQNSGIYGRAGADSLKIWNLLSITVFRGVLRFVKVDLF